MSVILFIHVSAFYILVSGSLGWASNQGSLSWCSYIVAPNGTCLNSTSIPCHTIDFYTKTAHFQSNSTFCFMSGIHVLHVETFTIENLSDITFIGLGNYVQRSLEEKVDEFHFSPNIENDTIITFLEPTAIIQCTNFSGFLFSNITNLSLINLTIANCGADVTNTLLQVQEANPIIGMKLVHYVAILMVNITNLVIETTSIQNSTGYGLMGINILGQSQMNGSSFVGNNQFVKDNLQLYSPAATYCNDGSNYIARSFYVNNATSEKNLYTGGNAVFVFYQLSNYSAEPVLKISFCLFALGIDGSIGLIDGNTLSNMFNSMGTGLGILMPQNAYGISIIITNTIAYGNQAFRGANLNLLVNPASGGIMLSGVYSARGVSWIGGGLYISINPLLLPDQNTITLLNSVLSTDYNPDNGIYIIVPNQITASVMVHIENSTLSSNLMLSSVDTAISAKHISATINNTLFGATGCSGGIGAFYASLKLSNCTFNRTNLYASQSYAEIEDSTFENSLFSANDLFYTHLLLKGNVSYVNNKAIVHGGAQYLYNSDLTVRAPANIMFVNNVARYGGAINVYTKGNDGNCIFHLIDPNGTLESPGIHLYFEGNMADEAGSVLFGGDIDLCFYNCTSTPKYAGCVHVPNGYMVTVVKKLGTYSNNGNKSLMISSEPRSVCGCTNNLIDCNGMPGPIKTVFPGQIIYIPVITVGQLLGASPDTVLSYTCNVGSDEYHLLTCTVPSLNDQFQQLTRQYCTNYSYTAVWNNQVNTTQVFLVPKIAYTESYTYASCATLVRVLPCPFGFVLNQSSQKCTCSSVLLKYNIQCDIGDQRVFRTANIWVGNTSNRILAVHKHCPYDYCIATDISFAVLDDQDAQCAHDHSGVLCGRCKPHLSAVFGSAQCKLCNDNYVWLLIPISIMGVVMVAFLFLLNCTVSVGTLNGLILYTNIIQPGVVNLLPTTSQNGFEKFLIVFVDWMNLDLGIETCFYDGMDTYAKTWLELLFPVYLLAMVAAIIIGSRWSSKLAWISKRNAVAVLATLVLLSYTTLLQSVLTIFSYTDLDVAIEPNIHNPTVWLADGNILYAQGKHIYLLLAGLLILVIFIFPFTSMLLLSPWLQAKSHWRGLQWMIRVKPFIDSYQSPYKDRYRYWPGVHLVIRIVLYVVFTTNQVNDININLLACALVVGLYCGMANILSIYKNSFLTILEVLLMTNIVILSTSMLYVNASVDTNNILTTISIASALCIFVVIVAFHSKDLIQSFRKKKLSHVNECVSYESLETTDVQESGNSTNILNYREPLLDDD